MSDAPSEYRAYIIGEGDHFRDVRTFAFDNDADAIVWAKRLVDGHDVELWNRDRLIIRLSSKE